MITELIAILCILNLITVYVSRLNLREVFSLHTVVFACCKTIKTNALCLTIDSCKCFEILTFLCISCHIEGCLWLRKHIIAIVRISTSERTVSLLSQLRETLIEHHCDDILCIRVYIVVHIALLCVREDVMLHTETNLAVWHLLILTKHVDSILSVWHSLFYYLCSIGRNSRISPKLLNLILSVIHIDITNNDDALIIWTIPLLIIIAEILIRELINNAHQTDWHAMTIL